ncbi:MAG TPA: DUF3857 and transglutaminase domain-containing protein [Candidatus Polarisedimenticolia bacterium]|nr:DUF3857 and transglutaminase domain-containing protein [Candidatus Polarisedimenticolia bacterium]
MIRPAVVLSLSLASGAAWSWASPIDPKHLAIADCPQEPGCPAMVLLDHSELDNEAHRSKYSVRRLLKLFTAEGIERFSDVTTPTSIGGWEVRNLRGRTVLPDGTEHELKQDNIFVKTLRVGKRWSKTKSATFPGVVPGAIIEYSYDVLTEPGSIMTEVAWEPQEAIPVLKSRFLLKEGKYPLTWRRGGTGAITVEETRPYKNVRSFTASDVPSLPREPLGPPGAALRVRLLFGLPDLQSSWLGVLAGRVAGRTGGFIHDAPGVAAKVAELVKPGAVPLDKVKAIYAFVQESIGTEEMRAGDAGQSQAGEAKHAGDVLARGYGDEFERTMLFLAMVREAGLEHGIMLASGRFSSAFDPNLPDEDQLDSYAAAVKVGAGWTFYDPAARHCPFGMISAEKEGGRAANAVLVNPMKGAGAAKEGLMSGLVVKTNAPSPYAIASVPFSASSRNVLTRHAAIRVLADATMEAEVSEKGSGLVDLGYRERYESLSAEDRESAFRSWLQASVPSAELTSVELKDLESFKGPAAISYTFRLPGQGGGGDRLIMAASLFQTPEGQALLSAEARRTPIHFRHSQRTEQKLTFTLPDGFEAEDLPAPVVVRDPPLFFSLSYALDEGRLVLNRRLDIDQPVWQPSEAGRLRDFFSRIRDADSTPLVLRKGGA